MADEYSYISSTSTDKCMRCSESFYRKSGNHVSNGTNMCDDIYAAIMVEGDSHGYKKYAGFKVSRVELGPMVVMKKRMLVVNKASRN